MTRKGWHGQSARHSLARRGVKTPCKSWSEKKMTVAKQFQSEANISATSRLLVWPNPVSNKASEKVLVNFIHDKDEIDYYLKNHGYQNLLIVPFLNGRERGYTAVYGDKEVSWCQHRNSDDIVVYPFKWLGKNSEEDFKTKSIFLTSDEKAYKHILVNLGIHIR
jgi:hypothetical protein